jgi:hypothetical protein
MRPLLLSAVAFFAMLTSAWAGAACPSCAEGRAARQQVFGDGFATSLMITLAPFVLVGLVSMWAERIGKAR